MKPPVFEYHAPETVPEALRLLATLGREAMVLAGGQSLVPMLNHRLIRPAHIVDINGLHALTQIHVRDGGLALGAMVRQRTAERSTLVRESCPLMAEALPLIAHPQIRNRGTIGGSLAHADPAAELPTVVSALEADLVLRSVRGERILKPVEYFVGSMTTTMQPDELLVEIRLPAWPAGAGWSYLEVCRRYGDHPLVGVATLIRLDRDGVIADARLTFTAAGPVPMRAVDAEQQLVGEQPSEKLFAAASKRATAALDPLEDVHASAGYRLQVAKVLARRSLEESVRRTGEAA